MAIIGCGAQPTSNQLGGLGAMQYMQYACPRGWDQIRSTQLNASEPQQTALGRQRTLVDAGFPCQKNKSCCLMSPKICLSWLRSVCWIENPMSSLFHWRSFSWGDCKASQVRDSAAPYTTYILYIKRICGCRCGWKSHPHLSTYRITLWKFTNERNVFSKSL